MTPESPTVGLALIVKNEADNLPRLLDSVEGAFDQIVLLDTGSTDATVDIFRAWCEELGVPHDVGSFDWTNDFSAARNAADAMLTTDWFAWADADDTILGAQNLRQIAAQAPPDVAGFIADYAYAHDPHGNCICTLSRERLVRAHAGVWEGRVHEAQRVNGPCARLDPSVVRWVHHKIYTPDGPSSNERNLLILQAWEKDEPRNPRVLGYLGTELAAQNRFQDALVFFHRYLDEKTGWDEERAQIHRKLAVCLMSLERNQDALETALAALPVVPDWPDTYLTLAQACYKLGEHEKAIKWAHDVLRLGAPESMLILNPLDYTLQPRLVLAGAYGALGQTDEAIRWAQEALQIVPDYGELRAHFARWQATAKREYVARTFVGAAQLLVQEDEQVKALTLLEQTVPYFAQDHPAVVAERSRVRERLLWLHDADSYARHYTEGGSKPEDFHDEKTALEICDHLPRVAFLEAGLRDLAEAA